jgi:hypothetical protein
VKWRRFKEKEMGSSNPSAGRSGYHHLIPNSQGRLSPLCRSIGNRSRASLRSSASFWYRNPCRKTSFAEETLFDGAELGREINHLTSLLAHTIEYSGNILRNLRLHCRHRLGDMIAAIAAERGGLPIRIQVFGALPCNKNHAAWSHFCCAPRFGG